METREGHVRPGVPARAVLAAALLVLLLAAPALAARAQGEPAIEWEQLYGGSARDELSAVCATADGGYIAVGTSWSSKSGDVTAETRGGYGDIWAVKVDAAGAIAWQRLLGGDGEDHASSVLQTAEGGYIVLGYSGSSQSGEVQSTTNGPRDLWVVKLGPAGAVEWEQLIGGSDDDFAACIRQAPSGAYVILGTTRSPAGGYIATGTHGGYDVLLVVLDDSGTFQVSTTLGGTGDEFGCALRYAPGAGWLVLAETNSGAGGQVEGTPRGGQDLWVLQTDGGLGLAWQRRLGGAGTERGGDAVRTADGGWLVVGSSDSSASGDVTAASHGDEDVWAVKLGASGATAWDRLCGGGGSERAHAVLETSPGGSLVLGESFSSENGDVTGVNHGAQVSVSTDAWLVALDATGGVAWQRLLGGADTEFGTALARTLDGGLVLGGASWSPAGWDVRGGSTGESDYWLARLDPVVAVAGGAGVPGDADRDGLFEDVNGNGRKDFADVVLFFNQMGPIEADQPARAFDYNRNGRIDFADVVLLFGAL